MKRGRREGSPWTSWSLSILLHGAIVAAIAGLWYWSQRSRPAEPLAIEGSVVTAAELAEMTAPRAEPVPEPEPLPEPAPEPVPEELPPPEEDPALLQAEAERVAEERRIAEAQQEAERKAREEAERQQAERERRERAEKEKAERERLAKERAERERREREQAEQRQRESELAAQLAAEDQRQAVRGSVEARQYSDLIRARIERAWLQFASARSGLVCEIRVTQIPGGTVTDVQIGRCNGDDSVRQSLRDAVYRASPLPQPSDPALFERELNMTFRKD
jgi:colicin import membrane protein